MAVRRGDVAARRGDAIGLGVRQGIQCPLVVKWVVVDANAGCCAVDKVAND